MVGSRIRLAGLCVPLTALWLSACDTCPFQTTGLTTFDGVLEAGAMATHEVAFPRESDLEVDLSNSGAGGRTDAWLTTPDCTQLFDGPYPSASPPRCRVFLGPVSTGTVSSRQKVDPGRYRIFVFAPDSNTEAARYAVTAGTWWHSCQPVGRG